MITTNNRRKIWVLSEKAVQAFMEAVKEEYGEEISNEQATKDALNFLTIFNLVFRKIKKEWTDEYPKKDKNI